MSQSAEAWVDAKQLSRILYSYVVNPDNVLCCTYLACCCAYLYSLYHVLVIVFVGLSERTVVLDVRQPDDLFITYYIPTLAPQ